MTKEHRLLALRKMRKFIIENPGKTCDEIQSHLGFYGVSQLQSKGLIYWNRCEDGRARYYVRANLAYPNNGVNEESK